MSKETKEKSAISFSFDSIDDVHDDIQEQSSDVNQAAVAAHQEKETATIEQKAKVSGTVDSGGTAFNPELHATDADGNPSITPKGKFRKKRGASNVQTQTQAMQQQEKINNSRAAASAAVDMSLQSLEMLLGPEWKPIQKDNMDERQNLKDATANYFIAKDINDFPPGVALSVVVMAYAMPRFVGGEETKTRLSKAKIWATEKFNNLKRKRKNASQSDSRDDGKRKDNASKETVRSEQEPRTRHLSPR